MNKTLPLDTIGLFGKKIKLKDLQANPAIKYWFHTENIVAFNIVCPTTGYTRVLNYHRGYATCSIEIALPKLVYPTNQQLLTLPEAKEAIETLSEHTGLNLHDFAISRLDVTMDITFKPTSLKMLKPQLQAPKYYQKERIDYSDSDNFSFGTKPRPVRGNTEKLRSDKQITFYAKQGKTRMESKLFSAAVIKRTLGLNLNLKLKDVLTDAFITRADEYQAGLLDQITAKSPRHKLVKGFKKVALAGLEAACLC